MRSWILCRGAIRPKVLQIAFSRTARVFPLHRSERRQLCPQPSSSSAVPGSSFHKQFSMSPRSAPQERLTEFFDTNTNGVDSQGRTLKEVLAWSNQDLEYSHDYIQNVFPLPEGSMFNSAIWLVTEESYSAFRERPELRESLSKAFERICAFYGLRLENDTSKPQTALQVMRAEDFNRAKTVWLSRFNHNHLRITRILRSLRVLGLPDHAAAFHAFLQTDPEVDAKVSPTSKMYWKRAAERPLRLPPDEDDDAAQGIDWLRDKS